MHFLTTACAQRRTRSGDLRPARTPSPDFEADRVRHTRGAGLAGRRAGCRGPPADGHRRTILDPDATHVGVGWAQERGQFRMAQEFLTRRLAHLTLQRVAEDPNTVLFRGRMQPPYRLDFVTFAYEPTPLPLTREAASARAMYAYPQAGLAYAPEGIKSMQVVGALTEDRSLSRTAILVSLHASGPGLDGQLLRVTGSERPKPGGLAVSVVRRPAVITGSCGQEGVRGRIRRGGPFREIMTAGGIEDVSRLPATGVDAA